MPDPINFDLYPPVFPKSEINEQDRRKGELRRKPVEEPVPDEKDKITIKGKTSSQKDKKNEAKDSDEEEKNENPDHETHDENHRPRKTIDIRV